MADGVFNISKGRWIEKIADAAANVGLMFLQAAEADGTLIDYDDVAALLVPAGNTEADFTNYARKTGLTGTILIDDTNDWCDVDIPDQTFTSAGGATNNSLVKAVTFYNDGAGDANQVPMTHHDVTVTTDGNDLTVQINSEGIGRAA